MPTDTVADEPADTDATDAADEASLDTSDDRPDWSARLALWVFIAYAVFAFPYIQLGPGDYHWFLRDEWVFFTERRELTLHNLFAPFNVHLVALPVLAYIVLWNLFGASSYVPYQSTVVGLHVTAAVLIRVVMRRAGVSPWIATAAASLFVLYGPGAQNIVWAFQIGFTGALVLGLVQILLADHDGPVGWRDGLGVLAGILAVMSTGVGVTMAIVAGIAVLLRRGWRVAALYTVPMAVLYGTWFLTEHPDTTGPFGRPTAGMVVEWLQNAVTGTYVGMAHYRPLAVAMALVLVAGAALSWAPAIPPLARRAGLDRVPWRELSHRWALPAALLAGSFVFPTLTAIGRASLNMNQARTSRYIHLGAALTLPALALAADTLARRWRLLTIPLIALFLVPIPANIDAFEPKVFGPDYMLQREEILGNAVRMPFARRVPRDVRPIPDAYDGKLTIGFLLDAHDDGKFPASTSPVPPFLRNELRIRLGLAQRPAPYGALPIACKERVLPFDMRLHRGDWFMATSPIAVVTVDHGVATSRPVIFVPGNGQRFTAELPGLHIRLRPVPGLFTYTACGV